MDAVYFGVLIFLGIVVLVRRGVFGLSLLRQNIWLLLFILFGLLSVLWSEFPAIAIKRWVKSLGHPVMALVVLTDPLPRQAIGLVMTRIASLLLPTSILFVKYLPEYGRGFDFWTGTGYYNGVMHTKNDLGYVCMVLGIFFVWTVLNRNKGSNSSSIRERTFVSIMFLVMIVYLLGIADSATSIATLTIGVLTLLGLGSRLVSRRHFGSFLIILTATLLTMEFSFDIYNNVVTFLGRDPTLTDRTVIWADAIALQSNPVVGMGFESFWLGDRLDWMSEKWWWQPNQAHNGYIEIYLNLGFIGLFLFIALIISAFRNASSGLTIPAKFEFSRLRLAFLFAILSHNYTEATFKGVHLLWTILYLVAIHVPEQEAERDSVRKRKSLASQHHGLA